MAGQKYSRQEIDAILGRALEREPAGDALSHEELVAVAREVGVSPEAIERAAAEVLGERRDRERLGALRARDWRQFVGHLIPFLSVNALLITINLLTSSFPWALFPLLGWGTGILSHLFAVLMPGPERLRRRLEREQEREQRRLDRERRRRVKRELQGRARELQSAVGQGVAELLRVAAERVGDDHPRVVDPPRGPPLRVRPEEPVERAPGGDDPTPSARRRTER